jgi:hypothetical protein
MIEREEFPTMWTKKVAVLYAALFLSAVVGVVGQSPSQSPSTPTKTTQLWSLPQGLSVKDSGPRTYRFTVDYNTANSKGEVIYRQHVTGDYTRGLPGGDMVWKNVAVADAAGPAAPFSAVQKRDFMEGFRYRKDANTLSPDFFKGFPATAVVERNLVWDTGMIEMLGQNNFDRLKLNEPVSNASNDDVAMPGVGTFHLRDIVLEWIGRSERNGQDCAVIKYESFFNPLEIDNGGMTMKGRSDFWGEIWVSVETKQIEHATLNEVVVAEMKLSGQDTPQTVNVFRSGVFELVSAR